jgi:hypothetical protein
MMSGVPAQLVPPLACRKCRSSVSLGNSLILRSGKPEAKVFQAVRLASGYRHVVPTAVTDDREVLDRDSNPEFQS